MSIVTKKGDSGMTGLAGGGRVSKADVRIEAVGTLDELVSFLGLARSHVRDKAIAGHIKKIQSELFLIGTEIVTEGPRSGCPTLVGKNDTRLKSGIQKIENLISKFEQPLKGFIIPGDSKASAFVDIARVTCRRFERRLVALKEAGMFKNDVALKYINRLSDLLYIFARIM